MLSRSRLLANAGKSHSGTTGKAALRLQVSPQLRRADFAVFYRGLREFIGAIQEARIPLFLSGWAVEDGRLHFLNHRAIEPDTKTLIELEYALPDNPDYA